MFLGGVPRYFFSFLLIRFLGVIITACGMGFPATAAAFSLDGWRHPGYRHHGPRKRPRDNCRRRCPRPYFFGSSGLSLETVRLAATADPDSAAIADSHRKQGLQECGPRPATTSLYRSRHVNIEPGDGAKSSWGRNRPHQCVLAHLFTIEWPNVKIEI